MTEPQQTVRDIINKYSPIVNGRKGILGLAFKAVARPLEWAERALNSVEQWIAPNGFTNTAGQLLIDTSPAVVDTLAHMESRLQQSFNTASAKAATPETREQFLSLAQEVQKDALVLAPEAHVVNNELNLAPEQYKFILLKGEDGAASTTLEQGVATMTPVPEHKNPVTVRRNPNPYSQPNTEKKAVGL